ncbi:hypothetical protein SAMN06309944_0568 [Micrococcales bacterium KH10]|nr:hypothetical protein SAMN06309944_0568 [Micrococcales bacterium KH10]
MSSTHQGDVTPRRMPEIIEAPTRKSLRAAQTREEQAIPYTRRQMRERAAQLQETRTAQQSAVAGTPGSGAQPATRHAAHRAAHSASVPAAESGGTSSSQPLTRKQMRAARSADSGAVAAVGGAGVAASQPATRRARRAQHQPETPAATETQQPSRREIRRSAEHALGSSAENPASSAEPVESPATASIEPAATPDAPLTRAQLRARARAQANNAPVAEPASPVEPAETRSPSAAPTRAQLRAGRRAEGADTQEETVAAQEPQTRRARREAGLTGQIPIVTAAQVSPPPHTGAIRRVDEHGQVGPVEPVRPGQFTGSVPVQSARPAATTTPEPPSVPHDDSASQWAQLAQDSGLNTDSRQDRRPVTESQTVAPDAPPRNPAVRPQRSAPVSAPTRSTTSTPALPIGDEPERFDPQQIVEQSLRHEREAQSAERSPDAGQQYVPPFEQYSGEVHQVAQSSGVPSDPAPRGSLPVVEPAQHETTQPDPTPHLYPAAYPASGAQPAAPAAAPSPRPASPQSAGVDFRPTTGPQRDVAAAPASPSPQSAPTTTGSIPVADDPGAMHSTLATGSIPVVRANTPSQPIQAVAEPQPLDDEDLDLDEDHKGLQRLHWGIIIAIALVLGLVIWKGDFDANGAPQLEHPAGTTVTSIAADTATNGYASR